MGGQASKTAPTPAAPPPASAQPEGKRPTPAGAPENSSLAHNENEPAPDGGSVQVLGSQRESSEKIESHLSVDPRTRRLLENQQRFSHSVPNVNRIRPSVAAREQIAEARFNRSRQNSLTAMQFRTAVSPPKLATLHGSANGGKPGEVRPAAAVAVTSPLRMMSMPGSELTAEIAAANHPPSKRQPYSNPRLRRHSLGGENNYQRAGASTPQLTSIAPAAQRANPLPPRTVLSDEQRAAVQERLEKADADYAGLQSQYSRLLEAYISSQSQLEQFKGETSERESLKAKVDFLSEQTQTVSKAMTELLRQRTVMEASFMSLAIGSPVGQQGSGAEGGASPSALKFNPKPGSKAAIEALQGTVKDPSMLYF